MTRKPFRTAFLLVAVAALGPATLRAQSAQTATPRPQQPAFKIPANVEVRDVDIYSEGTRMSGALFSDKGNAGKKLPIIVLAHGWGGVQASLRLEAAAFAQAGYLALTFDYRGWGTSDSKVVLTGKRMPSEVKNWHFTAEVQDRARSGGSVRHSDRLAERYRFCRGRAPG